MLPLNKMPINLACCRLCVSLCQSCPSVHHPFPFVFVFELFLKFLEKDKKILYLLLNRDLSWLCSAHCMVSLRIIYIGPPPSDWLPGCLLGCPSLFMFRIPLCCVFILMFIICCLLLLLTFSFHLCIGSCFRKNYLYLVSCKEVSSLLY